MPIINKPIEYSQEAKLKIAEKILQEGFCHSNWSDEDLEPVRKEIRDHYRKIQRLVCVYCQSPISNRSASGAPIEHIAPKSIYLQHIFEPRNLCVICPDCNEYKSKREVFNEPAIKNKNRVSYPTNTNDFRIMHPHFDDYERHIIKRNRLYVEITDKGGYTIYICNLNRFFKVFGQCDELVNDMDLVLQSENFHSRQEENS